jgi:hypothetical protein
MVHRMERGITIAPRILQIALMVHRMEPDITIAPRILPIAQMEPDITIAPRILQIALMVHRMEPDITIAHRIQPIAQMEPRMEPDITIAPRILPIAPKLIMAPRILPMAPRILLMEPKLTIALRILLIAPKLTMAPRILPKTILRTMTIKLPNLLRALGSTATILMLQEYAAGCLTSIPLLVTSQERSTVESPKLPHQISSAPRLKNTPSLVNRSDALPRIMRQSIAPRATLLSAAWDLTERIARTELLHIRIATKRRELRPKTRPKVKTELSILIREETDKTPKMAESPAFLREQ